MSPHVLRFHNQALEYMVLMDMDRGLQQLFLAIVGTQSCYVLYYVESVSEVRG